MTERKLVKYTFSLDQHNNLSPKFYTSFIGRVGEVDSLFLYDNGDTYSSINDLTFVPVFFNPNLTIMFPDDADKTQAQDICYEVGQEDPEPEARRECYFDFAVLKDADLAKSTANGIKKVAEEQITLGNICICTSIVII